VQAHTHTHTPSLHDPQPATHAQGARAVEDTRHLILLPSLVFPHSDWSVQGKACPHTLPFACDAHKQGWGSRALATQPLFGRKVATALRRSAAQPQAFAHWVSVRTAARQRVTIRIFRTAPAQAPTWNALLQTGGGLVSTHSAGHGLRKLSSPHVPCRTACRRIPAWRNLRRTNRATSRRQCLGLVAQASRSPMYPAKRVSHSRRLLTRRSIAHYPAPVDKKRALAAVTLLPIAAGPYTGHKQRNTDAPKAFTPTEADCDRGPHALLRADQHMTHGGRASGLSPNR